MITNVLSRFYDSQLCWNLINCFRRLNCHRRNVRCSCYNQGTRTAGLVNYARCMYHIDRQQARRGESTVAVEINKVLNKNISRLACSGRLIEDIWLHRLICLHWVTEFFWGFYICIICIFVSFVFTLVLGSHKRYMYGTSCSVNVHQCLFVLFIYLFYLDNSPAHGRQNKTLKKQAATIGYQGG